VAAEVYSRYFLSGFPPDGYCTEGLGYWNYGFGNYVLLCETVRQATGGGVDLFLRPEGRLPAAFGARIQIMNGVAPAFADCGVTARPDPATMYYGNRRLGLGLREYDELDLRAVRSNLPEALLFAFPHAASGAAPATAAAGPEIRTWFDQAGHSHRPPRAGFCLPPGRGP